MPADGTGAVPRTAAEGAAREGRKIVLPGQTPEGAWILAVLVKRTYDILPGGRCARSAEDRRLIPGDVHYGDPACSSVRFESDFVPFKVATDVVVEARAYAPGGRPVQQLDVSVSVGPFTKAVRVIGDRVARHRRGAAPVFTDPVPFTEMELRYELAYGGVDIVSDPKMPCVYPRNPLGKGFVIADRPETVDGLALPNVEDPLDPLTPERLCAGHFMNWERQPAPAGLGWVHKSWRPRAGFAGVMPGDRAVERELRKAYAAAVPPEQREMFEKTELPDMDFRFFNGASSGLVLPYLEGDEEVRLVHLSPEGETVFRLPGDRPRIGVDVGEGPVEPEAVLHTAQIRMEERQVDLVWRGAVPYAWPDRLPRMRKMEVEIR